MFDLRNFWGRNDEITLERLLKEVPVSKSAHCYRGDDYTVGEESASKNYFLFIDIRNGKNIGIFRYGRRRLDIPVQFSFWSPKHKVRETFMFISDTCMSSVDPCDDVLLLKLSPSGRTTRKDEKYHEDFSFDYSFMKSFPISLFLVPPRTVQYIMRNSADDELILNTIFGKSKEEAETAYRRMKSLPLLESAKIIVPPEGGITKTEIYNHGLTPNDLRRLADDMEQRGRQ